MAHIDDLPLFKNTQVALGILSSCVIHQPSYLTETILPFSSFPSLLVGFNIELCKYVGTLWVQGHGSLLKGPLTRCQAQLLIYFDGIGFLFMENCTASTFLGSWVLVAPYLCSMFFIFDKLVLKEYVF